MVEYVRLLKPSALYAQKQLLQSQLESLTIVQRIKRYHELRKEELILKIALKKKLDEIKTDISIFEKMLPKPQRTAEEEAILPIERQLRRNALEDEINTIRAKLSQLQ